MLPEARFVLLIGAALGAGACADFSENDHQTSRVTHWLITDDDTHQKLAEGCALSNGHASKVRFVASPGQHLSEKLFAEDVDKSQKETIPLADDAFWCGGLADAARNAIRARARETCASTDADAPASLDSVELIDSESSGLSTTATGYILHLTVRGAGDLRLVFKAPACEAAGSRLELTILE